MPAPRRARGAAGRTARRTAPASAGPERLLRPEARRRRSRRDRPDVPRRPGGAARHHEGRARGRPGAVAAVGNRTDGAARPLHARYNQTSSTTGRPLRWIDTPETWQWMLDCWKAVYRAAGVSARDRVFFPFSFGPFLGFWTGFDAATQIGAHAIPAGGMTSAQRLALIDALAPTVVCCTPTYALRLLDVAREAGGRDTPADSAVRVIVVAGEPGGSIPATRGRIERGWGGAGHRSPRPDGSRPDQLRVPGGARFPARQRTGVHRRGGRSGHGRAGGGRRPRRAGDHEPRADGESRHPLPYARPRGPDPRALAPAGAPSRGSPAASSPGPTTW